MFFTASTKTAPTPSGAARASRIVAGAPRPLALEARFVFDAAGGEAAAEAVVAPEIDTLDDAQHCGAAASPFEGVFAVTETLDAKENKEAIVREPSFLRLDTTPFTLGDISLVPGANDGYGNDLLVSVKIGEETYFGWISGEVTLEKGGPEVGYYLWLDPSFKQQQTALEGWNKGQKDPEKNNYGFLLAVDMSALQALAPNSTVHVNSSFDPQALIALFEQAHEPPIAVDNFVTFNEGDDAVTGNAITDQASGSNTSVDTGSGLKVVSFKIDGTVYPLNSGLITIQDVGTFEFNENGDYIFKPDEKFNGPVPEMEYTIEDENGCRATAKLILQGNPINDIPAANDIVLDLNEDGDIDFGWDLFQQNYSDVESSPLDKFQITSPPTKGLLQYGDGSTWEDVAAGRVFYAADFAAQKLRYTPEDHASGDTYATAEFQVYDGTDWSETREVTFNVKPVNDPPESRDTEVTLIAGGSYQFTMNDFPFEDPIEGDESSHVIITELPTQGFLVFDGVQIEGYQIPLEISRTDIEQGKLVYQSGTTQTSFQVSLKYKHRDVGGTANGGVDESALATVVLKATQGFGGGGPIDPETPPQPPTTNTPIVVSAPPAFVPFEPEAGPRPPAPAVRPFALELTNPLHAPLRFDSTLRPIEHLAAAEDDDDLNEPVFAQTPWRLESAAWLSYFGNYTDQPGWRTAVHPDTGETLAVLRGMPDQFVEAGGVSRISVPWDSFFHTRRDVRVTLDATLADGSPLPAWMQLNAETGVFELVPPPGFKGELAIRLLARDGQGREAVTIFRLDVGERAPTQPQEGAPAGRSAFSNQLREAARHRQAFADSLRTYEPRVTQPPVAALQPA